MRDEAFALRLRNANPLPASDEPRPDEALLARVLAEPRAPYEHRGIQRVALLFAVLAVLLGGTAAGVQRFVADYFGADDSEPTPAVVIAELRQLAAEQPDYVGRIDAERFVRLAAFDTAGGRVTVYIASASRRDAYCIVTATGGEVAGGACHPNEDPEKRIPYGSFGGTSYGGVRPVYGRLPSGVTAMDVRFQDGETRTASVRAPWWIYIAGGDETEPGHAPVELLARAADGSVLARQKLNPYTFMDQEAIEAAIPKSDGSPGQNGVRATLVLLGAHGAQIAPQVALDQTHLLRTVQTLRGSFHVYTAPWGHGGLCFGFADGGRDIDHDTHGCPSGAVLPDPSSTFDSDEIVTNRSAAGYGELDGRPPAGADRIAVRFEDGALAEADVSTPSFFIFWLEPQQLVTGRRPEQLVAWDANGEVIDTLALDFTNLS
jgi:hypothetical protein